MAQHDTLPLPDYDHLPIGSLESRIRSLDAEALQTVLDYERSHANRLVAVQVMERRLEELRRGEAQPSDGDPLAEKPELQTQPVGDTAVTPQTQGPPVNPPSHGDPTNPAQPRH